MKELIKLDLETKEFTGISGKKYYVAQANELSLDYFLEWQKLQPQVAYGADFTSLNKNLNRAYEAANNGKIADTGVILWNILNGIDKDIDKRTSPVLELCSLFIFGEDEDRTKFDAEYMQRKIEDWRNTGIDTISFFRFAFSLVIGLSEELEKVSQNTSLIAAMGKRQ